jgi:flavin-dependent dehydrogenase
LISGKKIIIAGGGLAGLIAAIRLARKGYDCTLIEKKTYPFHRVCGEYISNETVDFLKRENLYPQEFNPPQITQLQLSSVTGKSTITPLGLGGFGISRFTFDNHLFTVGQKAGVNFLLNTEIESIHRDQNFIVNTAEKNFSAEIVIGAFGKRSRLDVQLSRDFIKKRSPYIGVKYHAKTDHPDAIIALHNFQGGYCGVSNVEDGKTNICYLSHRNMLKRFGGIEALEKNVLFENPKLKKIFNEANFTFSKPEVINEISFETKEPVFNHILMAGDAAGMIAPLCGNGMAMAIHSAKILSDLIIEHGNDKDFSHQKLEQVYIALWRKAFSKRLWIGRQIQNKLFGTEWGSALGVNLALHSTFVSNTLIKLTHGKVF